MKRIITIVIMIIIVVIQVFRPRQYNKPVYNGQHVPATDSSCCTDTFLQDTGSGLLVTRHLLY